MFEKIKAWIKRKRETAREQQAADRLISIIKKPKTALVERAVVEGILLEGESVGRI